MKQTQESAAWIPRVILLLGTDASGKNHVARLWARKIREQGLDLVVRESWLCGDEAEQSCHDDKSGLSLFAERAFLKCYPLLKWMVPLVLTILLRWDAFRFKHINAHLLIVSNSALRILAFYLGQNRGYHANHRVPRYLEKALGKLQEVSGARVIVLDVDDETRQQRIQARLDAGSVDPFDLFMAADSERSERIEDCLVALCKDYYDAYLLENNDLGDDELWQALQKACHHF